MSLLCLEITRRTQHIVVPMAKIYYSDIVTKGILLGDKGGKRKKPR